jgi:adenylosuccinate lyase
MGDVWSEENRYRKWLAVEIATSEVLAQRGVVPVDAVEAIKAKARFDVSRIHEIEKEVKHDVIAFTTSVAEFLGPESRYVHFGLTSSDVVDTALALQLRDASALLMQGVRDLLVVLKRRAYEHKSTVMIGRTHGVHAEPMTLGLKLAGWYEEGQRNLRRC